MDHQYHYKNKPTRHINTRQDITDDNNQTPDWILHFDASFLKVDYTMGFAVYIVDITDRRRCIKAGSSWEACTLDAEANACSEALN